MRAGVLGELRPDPVCMPALELEPCELGHQIEFSWPDVAVRTAKDLGIAFLAEVKVV